MNDETKPPRLGTKSKFAMVGGAVALLVGGLFRFGIIDKEGQTAAEVARETWKLSITLLCNLPDPTRFGALEVGQTSLAVDGRGGAVACTSEELAALRVNESGDAVDAVVTEAEAAHEANEAEAANVVESTINEAEAAGVEIPVEVPAASQDVADAPEAEPAGAQGGAAD